MKDDEAKIRCQKLEYALTKGGLWFSPKLMYSWEAYDNKQSQMLLVDIAVNSDNPTFLYPVWVIFNTDIGNISQNRNN